MKTYADVLLSPTLGTQLLITSGNGSVLVAMLYLFGIDTTLANLLSKIIGINFATCYWLVYLFVFGSVLALNIVFIFLETRNCLSDSNDWQRVKYFIFQDRPIYNFSTGKKEPTKIPLYVFIFFGLMFIVSFFGSIDMMILSPLEMFITKDNSDYVFKYSSRVFYSVIILTYIPPYLFLLIKILFSHAISIVKQWIR